jgi:hypothetical protein
MLSESVSPPRPLRVLCASAVSSTHITLNLSLPRVRHHSMMISSTNTHARSPAPGCHAGMTPKL